MGTIVSANATRVLRVTILIAAPAVAMAGHLTHPWIGSPRDPGFLERLASAIAHDPTRWATSHLLVALGSGLMILAFLALHSHFRDLNGDRWSGVGLPFVAMGSVLYALLPALEFAPFAAHLSGADAAAAQAAVMPWFMPILVAAAAIFAAGVAAFVVAVVRSSIVPGQLTWLVAGALVVLAATRFLPVGAAQLYVGPAAAVIALWPLAYAVGRAPRSRAERRPPVRAAIPSTERPTAR